jgi:hypothetical protein
MKILVPVLAAFTLVGCALFHPQTTLAPDETVAAASYQPVPVDGPMANAEEHAACKAAGGEISRAGMLGREHCIQSYPDAGKACSGEADCLGTCRAPDGAVQAGAKTIGKCQAEDIPFGCYAMVEGGIVQHTLCVD